jgi:uncharacterized protein (DUF305 family)
MKCHFVSSMIGHASQALELSKLQEVTSQTEQQAKIKVSQNI